MVVLDTHAGVDATAIHFTANDNEQGCNAALLFTHKIRGHAHVQRLLFSIL